ncbi:unnamed protein product [Brugia timori]|uniref:Uncharacterized protein n=1 Tax=Brugia timori TaxID=42155 RepID=A0A0R3QYS0_9BILA|nr:unnamed protein product [Brugia timori]
MLFVFIQINMSSRYATQLSPNAPPSRITVVAEESEMPTTIMPPAQIEDAQNAAAVSSPPLPALVKLV